MKCSDAEADQQAAEECLLTREASGFITALHHNFEARRQECLTQRKRRQRQFDLGHLADFLDLKSDLGEREWTVAPLPPALREQRVVVAGPPEWDSLSRGLNAGADVFVADFDDCSSPTWANCLKYQANLRTFAGTMEVHTADDRIRNRTILFVRPRNWSLEEKHFLVKGSPISASLFDFGLYFFHNARTLLGSRTAPYFSLPKLESRLEARLWRDIFRFAEDQLGISRGSIRVNITIETVPAVSETEEILFELRDYAAALECSPSNYIASLAKSCRAYREALLPQRNDITMNQPFLRPYQELLIHTCHKRGVSVLSAGLPLFTAPYDPSRNPWVRSSPLPHAQCEIEMGFDGIRVADIDFVAIALSAFEGPVKARPNTGMTKSQCYISSGDLLSRAFGQVTMASLQENVQSILEYLDAWLTGDGSIRIGNRTENMANVELYRAQLWQWMRYSVRLACGRKVDRNLIECLVRDQLAAQECRIGEADYSASKFPLAAKLLLRACSDGLDSPLAVHAYVYLS
jgi:malate synthase